MIYSVLLADNFYSFTLGKSVNKNAFYRLAKNGNSRTSSTPLFKKRGFRPNFHYLRLNYKQLIKRYSHLYEVNIILIATELDTNIF